MFADNFFHLAFELRHGIVIGLDDLDFGFGGLYFIQHIGFDLPYLISLVAVEQLVFADGIKLRVLIFFAELLQ